MPAVIGTGASPGALSSQPLSIGGPAGRIQAVTDEAVDRDGGHSASRNAIAVVCHPHPLHQGTMHNKVVHTLARCYARRGFTAIRFNFRGVGDSEGEYADGEGETDDALAVIEHARAAYPGAELHLAGFSFGGMVAIRSAVAGRVVSLVTVAPAIRFFPATFDEPRCPWLVIQGEADEIVAPGDVRSWVSARDPGPVLETLAEVGHFFHGALGQLAAITDAFLDGLGTSAAGKRAADGAAGC